MGKFELRFLQVSAEKRLGAFRILGAYSWSKSIDNSSNWNDEGLNPFNFRISRSLSAFDLTHNFVASYTYEIPYPHFAQGGFGKMFLSGWQLSGITRFTTGLPITLTASGDRSLTGTGGIDRPNYTGAPIATLDPRDTSSHLFSIEALFRRRCWA